MKKYLTIILTLAVLIAMIIPATTVSAVPVPDVRVFTAGIAPTTALTSQSQGYTITITNDSSSTDDMGSVAITNPGFTSVSISSITASNSKTWAGDFTKIYASPASQTLDPGESVVVTFAATAPASTGDFEWTVVAWTGTNLNVNPLTIDGDQPSVTVSAPTDTTPPAIAFSFPAPDGSNGWYKTKPVNGSVTATDPSNVTAIAVTGGGTIGALTGGGTTSASRTISVSDEGTTTLSVVATDGVGNYNDPAVTRDIKIDTVAPTVAVQFPTVTPPLALQGTVTFEATASDATSGIDTVTLAILTTGYGALSTTLASGDENDGVWESDLFDTTSLADGLYQMVATATDEAGNTTDSVAVDFCIANYATVTLLPATENNKAGRTMPVKFAIFDEDGYFVYNEELTIRMYQTDDPGGDFDRSATFGPTSTDYRINLDTELYITNYKTEKGNPTEYTVEILWGGFLVADPFTFETTH